jgi:hypothetical protein
MRWAIAGQIVRIPYRLYFNAPEDTTLPPQSDSWLVMQCLLTRHSDGHVRHQALRRILLAGKRWVVPFVVLLAGEYVVEIIDDMVAALSKLDRDIYADFVHENRPLMAVLQARATSYWDCYYRHQYPNKHDYPGLVFFDRLEYWAK